MKGISDTIKEIQYRRLLKRSFEPRKEFLNASRELFLEEVAKRRVAPLAPQFAWHALGIRTVRYAAVFVAVVLVGTSGLVTYADSTNVSVSSPLYVLKRVGEQVRLVTTPAIKEPELRKEFAERRANELVEIEQKQQPDASGGVEQLRKLKTKEKELRADFRNNVEKIQEHTTQNADPSSVVMPETGLCQAAQVVEKDSNNGTSEVYKKFEDRCKKLLHIEDAPVIVATSTEIVPNADHRTLEIKKIEESKQKNQKNIDERSGKRAEQQ